MRERLLVAAEDLLREVGPARLTISAVAATVGMGQSNVYRYVKSRDHLVELLAERWFAAIEAAVARSMADARTPRDKIARWVIETMEQKSARYDHDPRLFAAYLDLAKDHGRVVAAHVERLRERVAPPVNELVGETHLGFALDLLDDATALFRTPHLIALHRQRMSARRAMAVVDALLLRFADLSRPDRRSRSVAPATATALSPK